MEEAITEALTSFSCFEAQAALAIVNTQKTQHTQNPSGNSNTV